MSPKTIAVNNMIDASKCLQIACSLLEEIQGKLPEGEAFFIQDVVHRLLKTSSDINCTLWSVECELQEPRDVCA